MYCKEGLTIETFINHGSTKTKGKGVCTECY